MMKKVSILFVVIILLMASTASAVVKWKLIDGSPFGDWGVASNWALGAIPTSADNVKTGMFGSESEIQVTGSEMMGYKVSFGAKAGVAAPLLRIMYDGILTQSTTGNAAANYLGDVSDAAAIVETGGLWDITHRLTLGKTAGVTGTLDIAGTVNIANNFYVGIVDGGDGVLNILDGGVLNLKGFGSGLNTTATSVISLAGTGMISAPGDQLGNAKSKINAGGFSGDGVLGNVEAKYDEGLDITTITVIPEPATMILLGLGGLLLRKRR